MGTLDGRVAFVTGVARGQGRSHAVKLAEEGADIIGVDALVDEPTVHYPLATRADLDETGQLIESLGRRAILSQADVRDLPALTAAVDAGVHSLGRLDIVVANAGIFSLGAVLDLHERTWQDMIDVNLTGAWHTLKAAVPHIRAGGRGGSVIMISSGAAIMPAARDRSLQRRQGGSGRAGQDPRAGARTGVHPGQLHRPGNVDTPMIDNEVTGAVHAPPRTADPGGRREARLTVRGSERAAGALGDIRRRQQCRGVPSPLTLAVSDRPRRSVDAGYLVKK